MLIPIDDNIINKASGCFDVIVMKQFKFIGL